MCFILILHLAIKVWASVVIVLTGKVTGYLQLKSDASQKDKKCSFEFTNQDFSWAKTIGLYGQRVDVAGNFISF